MRVSVIITNHNYGRFLGRAIQSCQAQKLMHDEMEVIVVDDASTDETPRVLDAYRENVRVVEHAEQRGLPAAINSGIRASRGQYIIRLDADDWFDKHICFIMAHFLDHNKEIGFVWPDYHLVDSQERVVGRISEPQGAGVMFRKQLLVDVGLYDESMRSHEDRDILMRCMRHDSSYHLKMPLYRYYRHGDNMTESASQMEVYRQRLVDKHGHDDPFASLAADPGAVPRGGSP